MTSSAVELAQQLVAMPSTPEHDQRDVAILLRDRLSSAGFATFVQEYGERTCNVIATLGDRAAPSLCFSGHLDTVPVVDDQWQRDPHGAEIADGRLWGRGATDMKGGVAALVYAVEEYARTTSGNGPPVSVVLTGGEELGCLGAAAAAGQENLLPSADALVIAEPTSNYPLHGHRGAVWMDVVAHGRSCHASTPELGINAIHRLTDCLDRIREWCSSNPNSHQVLGPRTMSTGVIRGGVQRNVVPDLASAELDFRTGDLDDWRSLAANLAHAIGEGGEVVTDVAVPPVCTDPSEELVRESVRIASTHLDDTPESPVARFITDASVLTPALGKPPTIIWGPGSADLAHVVDEWCSVDEIAAAAAMYGGLLETYRRSATF